MASSNISKPVGATVVERQSIVPSSTLKIAMPAVKPPAPPPSPPSATK